MGQVDVSLQVRVEGDHVYFEGWSLVAALRKAGYEKAADELEGTIKETLVETTETFHRSLGRPA